MSSCPTCSDEFDTERAMKIHHSSSHGKSIAIETSVCKVCESEFEYYPSEKSGIYCPDCVEAGENADIDRIPDDDKSFYKSGEENINYSGGKYITCDNCGRDTYASPSDIDNKKHHFCSDSCYRQWQSKQYQGEGNPFWKGGYNPKYSDGWWSARRRALERDGFECQICGTTESFDGRNCDVHHKKPVRIFDNPSDAHFLDNLITLCRSCHSDVENETERFK